MFMQNWLVAMPRGSHPIPFRIRSLSPSGPMVVIPQGIVRVGRCQPIFSLGAHSMGEKIVAPKPRRNFLMLRRRRTKKNLTAARLELPFLFVGPVTCGKSSLPALATKELHCCRLGYEARKAMSAEPDRPDFPPVPPTTSVNSNA